MNPAALLFPIFAIVLLLIGIQRGLEQDGFTQVDAWGFAIGLGLGALATIISGKMNKNAAASAQRGAALTTALFGSMMVKLLGAGIIFGLAYMLLDDKGEILFDINVAFMSYLAIVFLGFAMLPKLVQAPTRMKVNVASHEAKDDQTRAE